MADDSKNQDPEEEKNQSSNDDDFGLSDFEFDELEDDDDETESSSEESPVEVSSKDSAEESSGTEKDTDDLGEIDLEGIEDVDVETKEDSDDLDLEDLDLHDLDKELASIEEESVHTTEETPPVGATAEKIEDIFDEPKGEKEDDTKEEPIGEIEDDGEFYEEESFEDFDLDESTDEGSKDKSGETVSEDVPTEPEGEGETSDEMEVDLGDVEGADSEPVGDLAEALDDSGLDMDLGDALDDSDLLDLEEDSTEASTFDGDESGLDMDIGDGSAGSSVFDEDETPDVEFEKDEDAVRFSQRPVEGAEGLAEPEFVSDNYSDEVSEEEATGARSKFVKIVVIGTVMFVAIGFGFLYLNGNVPFGDGTDESKEVAKTVKKNPTKKSAAKIEAEKAASDDAKKATQTKKTTTTAKKPVKKPVKKAVTSTAGITTLSAKTGQSHLIVGSFGNSKLAQTYAAKLVAKGENPTIIPPFGTSSNYRVAVASYASWGIAETNLSSFRTKFSSSVWILRY